MALSTGEKIGLGAAILAGLGAVAVAVGFSGDKKPGQGRGVGQPAPSGTFGKIAARKKGCGCGR